MTDSRPRGISFRQVFADELAYLRRRWRAVYGDEAARREPETPAGDPPPSAERDLVGLALSGGGLGASTFQLGALEALDREGVFDHVDYLSTVSSGGFVGSTISTAMRDGGEFPFREAAGGRASPYLSWLRSALADTWNGGLVSYARSFGVLLRGVLISVLVLLPIWLWAAFGVVGYHGGTVAQWDAVIDAQGEATKTAAEAAAEAERLEKRASGGDPAAWARAEEARKAADRAAGELADLLRERPTTGQIFLIPGLLILAFLMLALISPALSPWSTRKGWRKGAHRGVEKAFVLLPALILLAVAFGLLPALIPPFHAFEAGGLRGYLAAAAIVGAVAILTAAGKLVSRLRGPRQRIALFLVALLAMVVPLLTILYVADDLIYFHPGPGTEAAGQARDFARDGTPQYLVTPHQPMALLRPGSGLDGPRLLTGVLLILMGGRVGGAAVGRLIGEGTRLRAIFAAVGIAAGAVAGYGLFVEYFNLLAALGSPDVGVLSLALVAFVFCWTTVDVNMTSPLGLYRDRLAGVYVIGVRQGTGGVAREPFVEPDYHLSDLCGGDSGMSQAPYHLLNAAVNLHGSRDVLRHQNHDAFVFSKHYCGGERTGYCRSEDLEQVSPQTNFQTAMTVSAASVCPNASRLTSRVRVYLMGFVNVRLGYWVPNPGRLCEWLPRRSARIPLSDRFISWRVSIIEMFREGWGAVDERHRFVNLSDGGNVDDTAAYELLRRRCKYVIVVDGAPDADHTFGSLILLRRRAQLDLGVDIQLSLEGLRLDRDRQTRRHAVAGRILYPPATEGGEPETGLLLYVRPSLTGDEDDLIAERRARSPDFPHERQAAEGIDDRQFSAYRALGVHSVEGLFDPSRDDAARSKLDFRRFKDWFEGLDERLTPKGIFISYRRADASGHALLIHKTLAKRFPHAEVFLDVGGIEPGEEFTAAIEQTLDRARITLVLIGNQWLGLQDASGARRLDDPDDTVRSEISMSLARGKRVIPLLVEQTPMPREDQLPDELRPLAYQNAVNLTHDRFDSDLETLVRILETFLD